MNETPLNLFHGKSSTAASVILIALGVLGAIIGFAIRPLASWAVLDTAFLVSLGIVNGILTWVAIFRVAQARWTQVITRIGQSSIAFVPILGILLVIMLAGAPVYARWVTHPIPAKQAWLNMPFFIIRELILLGVFWGLFILIIKWDLSADARDSSLLSSRRFHYRLNTAAAIAIVVYSIASSVVAFDFIMSLTPEWISTMFGMYIFSTNVYAAMAVIIILSAASLSVPVARQYIGPRQFQDMGNLMLAFALLNMGLFYAQYLTIWYENLPEETGFIIVRYLNGYWPRLGWTALIVGYAIPFVLLQSRYIKMNPRLISIVSAIALIGFALERYVLVVPSLYRNHLVPSPAALLILPGLIGIFMLCIRWFTHRYPAVSSSQSAINDVNNPKAATSL